MANQTNNKTASSKIKVTVGSRANIFHDQVTGITVVKGTVTELTTAQYRNRRVQTAIASGHLILVPDEVKAVEKYSKADIENLTNKVKALYEKGTTIDKIAGNITLEEAVLIAKANNVTVEKEDTVQDILQAVLED